MKYTLYREQELGCSLTTAWSFFSCAANLASITPPEMKFKVLSTLADDVIHEGMILDYAVSPLLGIPLQWQTLITQVDVLKSFTDYQVKGPYRYWNHFHEFVETDKGVLMSDTVVYELPFGFIGNWVHSLYVQRKLNCIFDYRSAILRGLFRQEEVSN
ncbi:SRPBCC family protein [Sphingobacterium sp. SYP-B4668]|uniref:SRPBCC family protein n=1 Tax=Sphingobacterium sp. SYP-B4668 TaxID=2996035 RepID=UPI0022DE2BE6|nr:SRPBCC family protein [Sphingobacterium sp. SYP-B4668]